MVGTSLVQCIDDIINGRVKIDEVQMIYSEGTEESADQLIEHFKNKWDTNPDLAADVCHELWNSERIQPIRPTHSEDGNLISDVKWWYENLSKFITFHLNQQRSGLVVTLFPDVLLNC